ncbi:MAG: hypothetical protein WD101_02005 [Gemmatimonadota bacterium]
MIRPVAVLGLLLAAATTACLDDSITGTRPLSFSLEVDRSTAEVGDSVVFTYDATGTSIFAVILAYGDGVVDTLPTGSSNQVERRESVGYAYETAGSYEVIGRVITSIGETADSVDVVINEGTE